MEWKSKKGQETERRKTESEENVLKTSKKLNYDF